MRVVLLAKQRHRFRPGVARLFELGERSGHVVELWDRDDVRNRGSNGASIDVVLAKSHYWKADVAHWLASTTARVINPAPANAVCQSRRGLDELLVGSGITTPPSLKVDEVPPAGERFVAKPDDSGDHGLVLVEPGSSLTAPTGKGLFLQQHLPVDETLKIYVFGSVRRAHQLSYPSATAIVDRSVSPERIDIGAPAGEPDAIVTAVAAATGLVVFNTDLVRSQGRWYVVDVNPFPGFERVPGAPEALWDLITTPR